MTEYFEKPSAKKSPKQEAQAMIEKMADNKVGITMLTNDMNKLLDQVIPDELKEKLQEIRDEFMPKIDALTEENKALEGVIKKAVLLIGESVKTDVGTATYSAGRVSWNDDALMGYAKAHPEIEGFRSTGTPYVSLKIK